MRSKRQSYGLRPTKQNRRQANRAQVGKSNRCRVCRFSLCRCQAAVKER